MHTIALNDLGPSTDPLRARLQAVIDEVLRSNWFLEGSQSAGIEAEFAAYVGCEHAVSVGNGTDALELALRAVGVCSGDEVVTVANAGGYTTTACIAIGATPHYADIEPDSLLIDVARVPECITPQTRAIVVTHLYGRMVDVAAVRQAVGAQIAIVEDCAQAHGAMLNGVRAGSSGDTSTFSFYPTKNLGALGDAGMVLTNSSSHYALLKKLKQYGWSSRYNISVPHGRNTRMDEIQAAVLRVKLPHLDQWNAERRAIAAAYNETLRHTRFRCFGENHHGNAHHLYITRHPQRDQVQARFKELGVSTTVHYPVLDCDQPGLRDLPKRSADLPISRQAIQEILTLPCYPGMPSATVNRVVAALQDAATL